MYIIYLYIYLFTTQCPAYIKRTISGRMEDSWSKPYEVFPPPSVGKSSFFLSGELWWYGISIYILYPIVLLKKTITLVIILCIFQNSKFNNIYVSHYHANQMNVICLMPTQSVGFTQPAPWVSFQWVDLWEDRGIYDIWDGPKSVERYRTQVCDINNFD